MTLNVNCQIKEMHVLLCDVFYKSRKFAKNAINEKTLYRTVSVKCFDMQIILALLRRTRRICLYRVMFNSNSKTFETHFIKNRVDKSNL